jgi:hypothetical protein
MRTLILATTAALALAGCDLVKAPDKAAPAEGAPAAPAANAFSHSQTEDLWGFYTVGEAQVGPGDYTLTYLFIGQAQEFADWEAGKRLATFAPVMLEFLVPGETTERVLPTSYSVSDSRIRMTGTSSNGEPVTFDGQLNLGTLATARRNLGGAEEPAIVATIRIGDQTYSGVKLNWNGGD